MKRVRYKTNHADVPITNLIDSSSTIRVKQDILPNRSNLVALHKCHVNGAIMFFDVMVHKCHCIKNITQETRNDPPPVENDPLPMENDPTPPMENYRLTPPMENDNVILINIICKLG